MFIYKIMSYLVFNSFRTKCLRGNCWIMLGYFSYSTIPVEICTSAVIRRSYMTELYPLVLKFICLTTPQFILLRLKGTFNSGRTPLLKYEMESDPTDFATSTWLLKTGWTRQGLTMLLINVTECAAEIMRSTNTFVETDEIFVPLISTK